MSFYLLGSIEFEIIKPIYGPSVFNDFLLEKGEGVHHLGFDIDNIEKKIEIFKKRGISILQSQKYTEAHSAYLKTEKGGGMILS